MTYLVYGCFNWIGFHLTQKLMDEGIEVIGIDSIQSERQEHFMLSIGRNSLFQQKDDWKQLESKWKQIKEVVMVEPNQIEQVKRNHINPFVLTSKPDVKIENGVILELPLLYGEWMPRDKHGIFHQNDYIRFNSDTFKENAIYMDDFLDAILQIVNSRIKQEHIVFKSVRRNGPDENDKENEVFIRDSETLEHRLKFLENHYNRFSEIYGI